MPRAEAKKMEAVKVTAVGRGRMRDNEKEEEKKIGRRMRKKDVGGLREKRARRKAEGDGRERTQAGKGKMRAVARWIG